MTVLAAVTASTVLAVALLVRWARQLNRRSQLLDDLAHQLHQRSSTLDDREARGRPLEIRAAREAAHEARLTRAFGPRKDLPC